MISNVPEVIGVDPEGEKSRLKAIDGLRVCIAKRWGHVYHMQLSLAYDDFKSLVDDLLGCVSDLIERHGKDLPFAPDLSCMTETFRDSCLGTVVKVVEKKEGQGDDAESLALTKSENSLSSNASSRSCLPHEFRWVQMKEGVWTVIQALWVGKVECVVQSLFLVFVNNGVCIN